MPRPAAPPETRQGQRHEASLAPPTSIASRRSAAAAAGSATQASRRSPYAAARTGAFKRRAGRAARSRCWLLDSKGLVVAGRADLAAHKRPYAHAHAPVATLREAIERLKPTALIGVAATGGAFTDGVLRAMARLNARPIVFALSNPTSRSECTAQQAYRCTDGRALFASGSPFAEVELDGSRFVPRQGNHAYVFPGVGLGAIASRARRVTDEMFLAAARSLAAQVSEADLVQGSLFPPLASVREVCARIAADVAEVAYARGLAARTRTRDVPAGVRGRIYVPAYPTGASLGRL